MAKMGSGTGLRKIALSQIVDTGNVREDYAEIAELAESIKKNGQLEPVLVKVLEPDEDGIEKFELVAGHRRRKALEKLCEAGEGFTNIDALVVTGDKLTLQLVENLQRSDLTAPERERGIYQMCKNGISQKEVAARLSKPEGYISRNVSAYKVREAAGLDAIGLATGTLNEIQAAKAADYPALVKKILERGGTLEAARAVMEEYRLAHGKPANPQKEKTWAEPPADPPKAEKENYGGGISDPLGIDPLAGADFYDDLPDYMRENEAAETAPPEKPAQKPECRKKAVPLERWVDEFDPPHKQVDFNDICLAIIRYAEKQEINKCPVCLDNGDCEKCSTNHFCEAYYKVEAARDIIALLHSGLQ
jgi:ParB/RepB/Spo0J family partition protein